MASLPFLWPYSTRELPQSGLRPASSLREGAYGHTHKPKGPTEGAYAHTRKPKGSLPEGAVTRSVTEGVLHRPLIPHPRIFERNKTFI